VAVALIAGATVVPSGPLSAASVPSMPRNVSVLAGNGSATVRWSPPALPGSAPVTGYVVSAHVGSRQVKAIRVGTVTNKVVHGLQNGQPYYFRVAARNANGRGKQAMSAVVTIGTPSPPRNVKATRGVRSATVQWDTPAITNGSAITGYNVVPYLDGKKLAARSYSASATNAVVGGLAVGRSYKFLVGARNARGSGLQSLPTATVNPTSTLRADAPPPAGGYLPTLGPNATLPPARSCATKVRYSDWEPRPGNAVKNRRTPKRPLTVRQHPDFNAEWNAKYRPRISGNFTGTTEEIIQWAACKWGLADEMLRGQAVTESNWNMHVEGDYEDRSEGVCTLGDRRDPCPTSFGILQIKWYYNPDANPKHNSFPMSKTMTAFSLDYTAAMLRGCFQGWQYFGSQSRGDLWGCMGAWWSGDWYDAGAQAYIDRVRHQYDTKPWRHWSG
jgi:autotransporter family porin